MESPNLYKAQYPHALPWGKRIRCLQEGDTLERDGQRYRVQQVILSSMSRYPRIILEPIKLKCTSTT